MTDVLIKRMDLYTETDIEERRYEDTQEEHGHVTGVMHLQVKEHWRAEARKCKSRMGQTD